MKLPARLLVASVGVMIAALMLACGEDGNPSETRATTPVSTLSGKITVFAAASLTDSFNEIKDAFVKKYPGTQVQFQFAGSPTLRTQLEQGASADVYASADLTNMVQALNAGVVRDAGRVFARNSLVIITPKANPGGVNAPADLRKSGLKLVLAAPEVPVGSYARQSLGLMEKDPAYGAGFADAVMRNLVSNESNVKQVVAKVQLGEADAGIVYGTDVTAGVKNDLRQVAIPDNLNVSAEYLIALTRAPSNAPLAEAFVAFVMGPEGQAILQKYGFQTLF